APFGRGLLRCGIFNPVHVGYGSKPEILERSNVFRFAPESGPPICALMRTSASDLSFSHETTQDRLHIVERPSSRRARVQWRRYETRNVVPFSMQARSPQGD